MRSQTPEYWILINIKQRCLNPRNKRYRLYGGRGIRICDEWARKGGFAAFLAHVGPRPSPKHSVDRIDNNGNYEPGNVRWATQREQMRNSRINRNITAQGETLSLAEWSERTGLGVGCIASRISRYGWTEQAAVTTPVITEKHRFRVRAGSEHHAAVLTDAQVIEMRALRNEGAQLKDIAARFGVSESNVGMICKRRTWKHLP